MLGCAVGFWLVPGEEHCCEGYVEELAACLPVLDAPLILGASVSVVDPLLMLGVSACVVVGFCAILVSYAPFPGGVFLEASWEGWGVQP